MACLPCEDNVVLREKCQNLVALPQSSSQLNRREREREGEWNEFHAQVSRVVYVTVQIASGARTRETLPIINPHFKWRLLMSEVEEKLVERDLAEDEGASI